MRIATKEMTDREGTKMNTAETRDLIKRTKKENFKKPSVTSKQDKMKKIIVIPVISTHLPGSNFAQCPTIHQQLIS